MDNKQHMDESVTFQDRADVANLSKSERRRSHDGMEDWLAVISSTLLERADTMIYAIVGVCFLLGALFALIYSFWDLATSMQLAMGTGNSTAIAASIIKFVSDLLLVLIIMEVLSTVIHYLKSHATSLRPFLFIGIVSATRSILSVGARLAIGGVVSTSFNEAMIELGVSAAVVLVLGITLKLLGSLLDVDATKN